MPVSGSTLWLRAAAGCSAPAPSSDVVCLSCADRPVPLLTFVFFPFTFFLFLLFPERQGRQTCT